jgi:hypothetical protein
MGEVDAVTEARIALALDRRDLFCGDTSAGERRQRLIAHVSDAKLERVEWRDGETYAELIARLYSEPVPNADQPAAESSPIQQTFGL